MTNKRLISMNVIFKVVFDVTTLKMARKPVKFHKENPAGCAGEGKHIKEN